MPKGNPKPKIANLTNMGKGRTPIPDRVTFQISSTAPKRKKLEALALSYNCTWNGEPWISGLLDKIAEGQLLVVPSPPSPSAHPEMTQQDLDWLNADLSRLGEYEPYDWGEQGPPDAKPVKYDDKQGWVLET